MPMNFARTGLLLAVLTGILVAMGGVVGGQAGMAIALVIAAGINLFSLWQSDKMVLRMYGAEEVDARSGGEYYRIVEDQACMIPMFEMATTRRARHISEVLMRYNRANPHNVGRVMLEEMRATVKRIRARPPYPPLAGRPSISNGAFTPRLANTSNR